MTCLWTMGVFTPFVGVVVVMVGVAPKNLKPQTPKACTTAASCPTTKLAVKVVIFSLDTSVMGIQVPWLGSYPSLPGMHCVL